MKSDNSRTLRLLISLQLFFGIWLTIAMIKGIQLRKANQFWNDILTDVRGIYDLLGVAVILLTFICLIGLLRKKRWGRELAIALNMTAFMYALGGRIVIYLFSIIYFRMPASALWEVSYELIASSFAAIISLSLIIAFSRKSIKTEFAKGF